MGHYFSVRFKKGIHEWSEKFPGSSAGNKTASDIRAWHRRILKRPKSARSFGLTGTKIVSIKKVTPKTKRKRKRKK